MGAYYMLKDSIRKIIEEVSYMSSDEIQSKYKDHVFLRYKNKGVAQALKGKVDVIVFFVNDKEGKWTPFSIEQAMKRYDSAMRILNAHAVCRGVDLNLSCVFKELTLSMVCSRNNSSEWQKAIAGLYNKKKMSDYQNYYKKKHACDEAVVMFSFCKDFRCFASHSEKKSTYNDEYSAIDYDAKEDDIIHELLHQFGAVDFYYPVQVKNLLLLLNYKSVMCENSFLYIDSLTSYIIGWTDCITEKAAKVLENTKHFTPEMIFEAKRKEWEE